MAWLTAEEASALREQLTAVLVPHLERSAERSAHPESAPPTPGWSRWWAGWCPAGPQRDGTAAR